MGVPNAAMWGVLVALLNFVPYFGPVAGVIVLATVGLLSFDNALERTPPASVVSAPPPFGGESRHARVVGTPFYAQPGRHICVVDFLDLALGRARRVVVRADSRGSIKVISDRVPAFSHVSELVTS